jgi:uncharacterized protein (TIGR04255 family)
MALPRPAGLPDFKKPPVVEVAISLQFAPVLKFRTIHAGLLWQHFQDEFPSVEEQGALNPQFETFGPARTVVQQMPQLQLFSTYPVPRYWFIGIDGSELFQIQQDRVVYNWRKVKPDSVYPHYEALREKFELYIGRVEKFFHESNLGEIKPNQGELTYVNQIDILEQHSDGNFRKIFNNWNAGDFASELGEIEDESFQLRCLLEHPAGHPEGRLYISANRGFVLADSRPVINLTLVARGKPRNESLEGGLSFLDAGRSAIVKSFTAITRKEMHAEWERLDD